MKTTSGTRIFYTMNYSVPLFKKKARKMEKKIIIGWIVGVHKTEVRMLQITAQQEAELEITEYIEPDDVTKKIQIINKYTIKMAKGHIIWINNNLKNK